MKRPTPARLVLSPTLLAIALVASCSPVRSGAAPGGTTVAIADAVEVPNSVEAIVSDMTMAHEGRPHGVPPSYGWAVGPRVGLGNDPGTFRAITAWGQLYEEAGGNPATNTRVAIRNIRTWILGRRSGTWRQVQASVSVAGGAYREDFVDDVNRAADTRPEPGGGLSTIAGGGYNFHFWPTTGRAPIEPGDIAGVFTTVQARLVLADAARPDDRAAARFVLGMGADYWLDLSAGWDRFRTNGDVGIGRFRFVRSEWQWFNMSSADADTLRRNPPPLD